jgi:hypothetical protein
MNGTSAAEVNSSLPELTKLVAIHDDWGGG